MQCKAGVRLRSLMICRSFVAGTEGQTERHRHAPILGETAFDTRDNQSSQRHHAVRINGQASPCVITHAALEMPFCESESNSSSIWLAMSACLPSWPGLPPLGRRTCPSMLSSSDCKASATCSNRSLLLVSTLLPSFPILEPTWAGRSGFQTGFALASLGVKAVL